VRGAKVGEHCFICEATVVHARAEIGDNVVLWSGNYVGHHAVIKSNCFTLPHVVVSERAQVGENCIIEANASLLVGVTVADDSRVAPGALVAEDVAARPAD
jgi:UDP-3-O-[3-hydroxymyristoyl] glucosamine N-acyltransferase